MEKWIDCTLSELGTVVGGATPSTKKIENYENGNISWITPKDLSTFSGRYISFGERFITEKGLKSCSTQLMPVGSILFSSRAPIGYIAIAKNELCTNQGFKSIVPNSNTDSLFLYYLLKYNKENIESLGTGTTFKEVSGTTMKNVKVRIPSDIDEQRKIAIFLGSIDDKIELNNRINDNLEQQAQLLFSQDFGQYTFATNDSEESDLPCSWKYYKMVDLCKHIKPGTNFQPKRVETGIPFLNVRCVNRGYIDTSDAKFITEVEYTRVHKTWQPEENDLLISRIGTLGLVAAIRKEDLPIAVHYNFINIKTSKLPFEFMYFLLKSKQFQTAYHFIKKHSVQEYVTIDEVEDIRIPLPDINTIDFSLYKDIYTMIVNNQRENKMLIHLRDSLLPKLMSGELDVSDIEF